MKQENKNKNIMENEKKEGYYLVNNHWVHYKSPMIIEEELKNWDIVGCVYPRNKKSYYIDHNIDSNTYDSITVDCEDGYFYAFLRRDIIKEIRKKLKDKQKINSFFLIP